MSDLQRRNTEAMISATDRFEGHVGELRREMILLNAKVSSLTIEVGQLKQEALLAKVAAQVAATGHGGT